MVKRVDQPTLNEIWRHCTFDSMQMEASGRSGGLLSIWRVDFFSFIQGWACKHWIATFLRYIPTNQIVLLVNVYAPHNEQKKTVLWSQLTCIVNNWSGPLCFLGDFNSVCSPEERLREGIDLNSINSFNQFISNANIIDQYLVNDEFTREGALGKFARIDRIFLNSTWSMWWPGAILITDLQDRSDHKPIILAKKLAAFLIGKKMRLLKADLKIWSESQQDKDVCCLKVIEEDIKRLKNCYKSRDLSQVELVELAALKGYKKRVAIKIESKRRLHSRPHWLKL
ncbi:uncharacterized protein [Rutidosis leptorrhynchoides]|uniref:uncharacterized protein n=1 Tax=Rutidosis leptorrhynchoides TaxID=125765 RepID=UPI003A9971FF